jgi:predicted RNA binding protein YcfA (HicA-like mRNA interferase family)
MPGADDRLLERARSHPAGLSFRDFERLLEHCGWRKVRQVGSHRVWRSPAGRMVPIQPTHGGKDAKEYQVRQFLKQYDKEHGGGSKE